MAYRAECSCGFRSTHTRPIDARRVLKRHICTPPPIDLTPHYRCTCCGRLFALLVDDLCVACDVMLWPEAVLTDA